MQSNSISDQSYSYRSHLWDSTDQILSYESELYSYMKNFLFVLSQIQSTENELSITSSILLSHINPSFCFQSKETELFKCFDLVYNQLQNINQIHSDISKQINNNLVIPLSEILNHNCNLRNEYENNLYSMIGLKSRLDNDIDTKLTEYHKKVNDDFEKQLTMNDKQIQNDNKDLLIQAKAAEKEYIDTINKSNNEIEFYYKSKTQILDNLQLLDKNILETLKRFYMDLFSFQNNAFQQYQNVLTKTNDIIKEMNPQHVIQTFIKSNRSTKTQLPHYDFHIFHPKNFSKANTPNYSFVKDYLVKNYPYNDPKFSHEQYGKEYQQIYNYIRLFIDDAPESEFARHKESVELITRTKDFQYYFLKCLNKYRSSLQNMKTASYEAVKNIMNLTLDKALIEHTNKTEFGQDDKLILIIRTIIILSQTFYNIEHPNGRMILQDDIKLHPIWNIPSVWQDIIHYHVNETESSKSNSTLSKERDKIKKDNITSALFSFKMNMEFFGVPLSISQDIIRSNCILYGLDEKDLFFN